MAATDPRREAEHREPDLARPRLAPAPEEHPARPRWVPIAIAVAVLAAIALVAYFVLYGGGGGGGPGGGGGGYAVITFSVDGARRLIGRIRGRR
jgi:hypothetical protein